MHTRIVICNIAQEDRCHEIIPTTKSGVVGMQKNKVTLFSLLRIYLFSHCISHDAISGGYHGNNWSLFSAFSQAEGLYCTVSEL